MSAAATTELTALPRSPSLPTFFDNLDSFAEAPEGVAKLRELILDLAVRGKLVEQDENDEPASELLERMRATRERLVSERKLKKSKLLPAVDDDELPYQLPSGWAATRIGQVTNISTGYAFKSPDYTPTGTFVLRVTNIKPDGTIIPDDAVFMPDEKITPRIESYYLEAGDILVVMVGGSLGKIGVVTEDLLPALLNQNMWRLRPISDDYNVEFLRLTLEYINRFQLNITSSTHGHMSMTEYKTQPIGVPPLSEQRRIVSKVDGLMSLCDELESRGSERVRLRERASRSCLDRLVSSRSRRDLSSAWQRLSDHFEVLYDTPETLAHLRQSILQLTSQGCLCEQYADEERAEIALERVAIERELLIEAGKLRREKPLAPLESNGQSALPKGWAFRPLGDVVNCFDHIRKPVSKREREKRRGDIPYFGANGQVGWIDDYLFNEPLVLVVEDESFEGRTKPFSYKITGKTWVNNHAHVLQPTSAIDVDFLNYSLSYYPFTPLTSGTTNRKKLTRAGLLNAPFRVPPLAEQKRIVAKVDQLLSQCDALSARLRERQSATRQLLTATIHEILSGGIK